LRHSEETLQSWLTAAAGIRQRLAEAVRN
jgi:hypothetical protein